MTKSERVRLYADHLKGIGYVPEVHGDTDIRFKVEGGTYQILLDDEEAYYSLLYPRFWPIRNEADRTKVEAAALEATGDTKVAKVYVTSDNNVTASFEAYYLPPEAFKQWFERSLKILKYAVKQFKQKMAQ